MTLFGFRYPAVIILVCVVAGTLLGRVLGSGWPFVTAVMITAALALAYAYMRLPAKYYIIPLAIFIITGSAIYAGMKYHIRAADDIGHYVGGEDKIGFFADVDKWPVIKRHKTVLVCRVDSIILGGVMQRSAGLIQLTIRQETTAFAFGDRISFTGRLRGPQSETFPGGFDYARYLHNRAIRGTVTVPTAAGVMIHAGRRNLFGRTVSAVRGWILACFQSNLTETPAALASGFLIGETHDIPEAVYRAFRRTGTMHLLAVSGSNVALVLVAAIFILRFMRVGNSPRTLALLAVIVVFSHLSYNQPSVVRASIMAALIIGARLVYRRIDLNNIIAAAAVILILADPTVLFDIGFQLSFAVTWGLILFLPCMNELCERYDFSKATRYISLIVFSSVIATLISAPITAYYFNEMSLVTVASNLIVVPLVSMAVLGSLILLGINLLLPPVAIVAGILLDRLLRIILAVVVWFGQWEFAEAQLGSIPAAMVFLYLGGAVALFLSFRHRTARMALAGIIIAAGALYLVGNSAALGSPSPEVEIFNTGSAHAVILNRADGLVIFRQLRDDPYDEFVSGLLAYLTRRRQSLPRYFVFFEPPYRTELHLQKALESELPVRFRPVPDEFPYEGFSVMIAGDSIPNESSFSPPIVTLENGKLTVQILNSSSLVYADGIRALRDDFGVGRGEAEYYIVAARDVNDVAANIPPGLVSRTVLLIPGSIPEQAKEGSAGRFSAIVEENSSLILPSTSNSVK